MSENDKKIIQQWLFLADLHYLSARLLMMHGIIPVGLHTGATSIEMYLKCTLQIKELDYKINHNLKLGFNRLKIKLSDNLLFFVERLQKSYLDEKYPDKWNDKDVKFELMLDELDLLVKETRNNLLLVGGKNKDIQDILKIASTGGSLLSITSHKYRTLVLKDIFLRANVFSEQFNFF